MQDEQASALAYLHLAAVRQRAHVTVLMSYTTDYHLGRVCEAVNRRWATRHGYDFVCEVLDPISMRDAIEQRAHATWPSSL